MTLRFARRVLAIAAALVFTTALAAPAAAQDDNPVAGLGMAHHRPVADIGRLPTVAYTAGIVQPTLDDPVSAYYPGAARQPVSADVQRLATPMGRIRIPVIEVDQVFLAGVDLSVLSHGPGHWVGTAGPGEAGNVVIAGHRSTYGAPFADLDRLQYGDMIYYEADRGPEVMYMVTETLIVRPNDIWITYETGEAITTLFACHPKGSAAQRIVVRAKLVGAGLLA